MCRVGLCKGSYDVDSEETPPISPSIHHPHCSSGWLLASHERWECRTVLAQRVRPPLMRRLVFLGGS